MKYTDQQMWDLAVNYLVAVGEMPKFVNNPLTLFQHCVNVYTRRKEIGLEQ
jgi:hypothetical protein